MIFDRTQFDVEEAKRLREKLQRGEQLNDDEVFALERGTFSLATINRIENKQAELYDLFIIAGYGGEEVFNVNWEFSDFFTDGDLLRLIDNGEKLKDAFFVYAGTPNRPQALYHFNEVNAIEKILYDLEKNYSYMASNWRECGTFESGGA